MLTIPDISSGSHNFNLRCRSSSDIDLKDLKSFAAGEHLDVSLPDDLRLAEEGDEEVRFTEDGIPIEPFNLKAEHWGGFFDADGNYLAYRDQDDTDAWLESLPGETLPLVIAF